MPINVIFVTIQLLKADSLESCALACSRESACRTFFFKVLHLTHCRWQVVMVMVNVIVMVMVKAMVMVMVMVMVIVMVILMVATRTGF